ncbi:hypothetical protein INT43_006954 [Umbelopsis isabellina]|uniref:Lipid storage droplets surface-binding protein 1 n=1 Tax=Mortierella isabellina TaxID=91625 RepID=A0A8H7PXE2_MORIS|nr:hypothetical protein INT43_006954 [Umbelopsis isabellina]
MKADNNNPYEVLDNDVAVPDSETVKVEQVRSNFFSRLASIPVVHDSWTTVYHYVNENSIGRYALTSTEGTIQKASGIIAPYMERYSEQLKAMDDMGNKSLDYVEQNYGVINKPTAEIFANVTEPVRQVRTTAKGYFDNTVYVVTRPVDLATHSILDNLEYAVDRVLPQQKKTVKRSKKKNDDEKKPVSQQERAYTLALDTKSRLISRFPTVEHIPSSRKELEQTLKANALLKGAFDRMERLDQSLRYSYTQTTDLTKKTLTEPLTQQFGTISKHMHDNYEAARSFADASVNGITAELVAHMDTTIDFVKTHNTYFPELVRNRLQPLLNFAGQEYDIIRAQLLNTDISTMQKARNVLGLSKDQIMPLLQESMDALHEELRYYQVYADKSKNDALKSLRGHLDSVAGSGIKA